MLSTKLKIDGDVDPGDYSPPEPEDTDYEDGQFGD